tara:strand:+ start:1864 stop:2094 length:231 start_codon:yes stop_codon:yes gene_type:complete
MKQKRQAKFKEIFVHEINNLCLDRTDIPGYRKALTDSLLAIVRAEQSRLDKDASSVGIYDDIKQQVEKLGDFIGDS